MKCNHKWITFEIDADQLPAESQVMARARNQQA